MGDLLNVLKMPEPERTKKLNEDFDPNLTYPVYSEKEFKCYYGTEKIPEDSDFRYGKKRILVVKKGLNYYPLEVAKWLLNKFGEGSRYGETNDFSRIGREKPVLLDYDPNSEVKLEKLNKDELEKFAVENGIEDVFSDKMGKKEMIEKIKFSLSEKKD